MTSVAIKTSQWKFSPIPNIEESNFNKILERFYGLGVQGLTKENIQNSLDGRLINSTAPVIVKIKMGTMNRKDIPGVSDVIDRIKCLEGRNSYTKETIDHMLKRVDQEEVRYISFEDMNTRGLTGAKNGQSHSKKDTWGIYAYNKGVHFEESDETIETTRGGSHGVGKIASNAASDLHLMYFANCDENGDQHLGGTVQLIEHSYHSQCFRSTGYFADVKEEHATSKFYPYENEFHPVFEKKTRGLKIIIPYLRSEFDSEDEIIKTVCDSFFISILDGRLEVQVNDHILNADTIENYLHSSQYYHQEISEMKKVFTPLYVKTYKSEQPRDIVVSNGEKDFNFKLYFKYNEAIVKGRVAIVRTIGMKIEDFAVKSNATKPYNAVLIGGLDEDSYLKSLENESHTKISAADIKDPKLKRQATRFINNLSNAIAKIIDEEMKRNNPTDGEMDTKDLLYIIETQFKQDLSHAFGAVKMNKGKNVVKTTDVTTKKKTKNSGEQEGAVKPRKTGIKRTRRNNPTGTADELQESGTEIFSVSPNLVERLIVKNHEFIQFNFKDIQEMKRKTSCHLSFNLVDGMGEEYKDEFKLKENYEDAIDQHTGSSCVIENESIRNVSIKKGMVKLKLDLKPNYNRALKFVYYVEV
ncbi:hypothetical protein BABA_10566 [Neobacillus bataviensis LMG 21833]|uniref:Uncharacterized protein n=1 Tax=Neobacillus bataviensis LMG 21833 TaxID=1117379 RepID=K6DLV8_9BACI|nr:hypothetical protein [Neobacillus bataviensis]EKN69299.1 hypothetical protein BABA_10566 [Neobacillus bataviensis LMG 21833]